MFRGLAAHQGHGDEVQKTVKGQDIVRGGNLFTERTLLEWILPIRRPTCHNQHCHVSQ